MQVVFGHDAVVTQWAAPKFDNLTQPTHAFGIIDAQGTLRGCIILQEITANTAELIVYAETHLTPNVIRAIFEVPFNRLGYGRLQTTVAKDNAKAKRENPRWGFKFEGTSKDFFGERKDALRFAMLRSDCKWLKRSAMRDKTHGTV
jgi:RimJ/RimL family protein N-acetyltransferase